MEKKTYMTPSMEEVNVETIEMMAMSLNEDEVNTAEDGVQLGRGRRGSWGNLWSSGEE